MRVTKQFEFCYGHCLPNHPGKCAREHGHNAILQVTFVGGVCADTGMVMDFGTIKKIVGPVIEQVDHQDLNEVFRNSSFMPPTAENLVMWFQRQIEANMMKSRSQTHNVFLAHLRLYETPTSWVDLEC